MDSQTRVDQKQEIKEEMGLLKAGTLEAVRIESGRE